MKIYNLKTREIIETEEREIIDLQALNYESKGYNSLLSWMELQGHFYGYEGKNLVYDVCY